MATKITQTTQIDDNRIRGLLCDAFEGGSNYWIDNICPELTGGLVFDDFKTGGSQQIPDDYWHWSQLVPLVEGCAVVVKDNEDGKFHRLDREAICRGLQLMADKYPEHFLDVVNENDDATTGDVFLQLCLFGELVFG